VAVYCTMQLTDGGRLYRAEGGAMDGGSGERKREHERERER